MRNEKMHCPFCGDDWRHDKRQFETIDVCDRCDAFQMVELIGSCGTYAERKEVYRGYSQMILNSLPEND